MKKDNIAEEILYPSVELKVLESQNDQIESSSDKALQEEDIICPKCQSKDYWKRGKLSGSRQQCSCKDCGKFFTVYLLVDEEGKEIKCPDCGSRNRNSNGKHGGKQRYKCKDCNRKYVLNPHGRENFQKYNNINCRWCNSKNFSNKGLTSNGKQQCYCLSCKRYFTVGAEKNSDSLVAPKEFNFYNDIWTAEHLGYEDGVHYHHKLHFSQIQQPWLKYYCKKFILYFSSTRLAFSTLSGRVSYFNIFSRFLSEIGYNQEINGIDRNLILEYFVYLNQQKYSYSQYTHCISTLKTFFETGILNHWFQVEPALIRPEDWMKKPKRNPRFIPEEVMKQLNQHLEHLPEPVMRMVLVDIECGFRFGELTRLNLDCLKSDGKGGWYVQYYMGKMKKEHTKPISNELANIAHLKRLAEDYEIKDNSGNIWNFQSHQFRHTVGTRMINSGVPQHIVQRYLGHESPEMTMVYAHIHDDTLRKEIEKYHDSRTVNFQGETVELEETVLSSNDDLEWFKKNVQARALEHGYCARPKVLGDCDIPGFDGCYTCPHWRTNKNFIPILEDTLERTNKVIEKARNCGWELQVKKNEPIKENLEKVIQSLEEEGESDEQEN